MPEDTGTGSGSSGRNSGASQGYLRKGYLWFLVFGNREVLSLILLLLIFAVTVLVGSISPGVAEQFLRAENMPGSALLYLLTGIITLVTVVLSINQLVLSHQLGSVEEQASAIRSLLDHRSAVSEHTESATTPERPTAFLSLLLTTIVGLIQDLGSRMDESDMLGQKHEQLREFIDAVEEDLDASQDRVDNTQFQSISLVSALERLNATSHLRKLRNHRRTAEDLPDNVAKTLNDLEEALELFVISGEYFKIAYLQTQFIQFSRSLLLIAIPALLSTFYASTIITPELTAGTTLGVDNLLWLTSGALSVSTAPFVLLISYMARLMTLSKTTVFSGPFTRKDTVEPFIQ